MSCPVGLIFFCFVIIFNSKEQKTLTQPALTMKKASCHLTSSWGRVALLWFTQMLSFHLLLVLLCSVGSHLQASSRRVG